MVVKTDQGSLRGKETQVNGGANLDKTFITLTTYVSHLEVLHIT